MINFQQIQALTSHFESFWSIVPYSVECRDFSTTLILHEITKLISFSLSKYSVKSSFHSPIVSRFHGIFCKLAMTVNFRFFDTVGFAL